jgi:DNA-directed RNA polymerase specialized sigma24 family protein
MANSQSNTSSKNSPNRADFLLAQACAAGIPEAWETFVTKYRQPPFCFLRGYTKADYVDVAEWTDSFITDLFLAKRRDGTHNFILAEYDGQGPLVSWLRSVMANRWVNSHKQRERARVLSIDQEQDTNPDWAAAVAPSFRTLPIERPDLLCKHWRVAISAALSGLSNEQRLILAAYHVGLQDQGAISGVLRLADRSQISRRLAVAEGELRRQIIRQLTKVGFSYMQIAEFAPEAIIPVLSQELQSEYQQRRHLFPCESSPEIEKKLLEAQGRHRAAAFAHKLGRTKSYRLLTGRTWSHAN